MDGRRAGRARGAVFVLPATTAGQQGPLASFMSTAGWANAARRVLGDAWIVTPGGVLDPESLRATGSAPRLASDSTRSLRSRVPLVAKTAFKDARSWRRGRAFTVDRDGPWSGHEVEFVWQRHELFQTAGLDLARALAVPSVLFVPATLVWEAREWGVTRPGWGPTVERLGEGRSLRRADLVACGSELVATQVCRLGVSDRRVLITPTGVDLELFAGSAAARTETRRRLGLEGFVVGWVGSFRQFHAVEQAFEAVARVEGATLLLVGDGPARPTLEQLATRLGVRAVFTGTVPHREVPHIMSAMDVGLILARADEAFHYSPLKLAEYLAAGVAVIGPRVPQLCERLRDGADALLVEPGDVGALGDAIESLRDEARRRAIATAGRQTAEARYSWDEQVSRVVSHLSLLERTL